MSSVSSRPAGQSSSAFSSKRDIPVDDILANKKAQSSSSSGKSDRSFKASIDGVKKKSLSTSFSSYSQQRYNGASNAGVDFGSLMQQASSNSADASQKITKIDVTTAAQARASAAKHALAISSAKLRKAVIERSASSSVKHSIGKRSDSQSTDSKAGSERRKQFEAKDAVKRQKAGGSSSGTSEKERREKKDGDRQINASKNLTREKGIVSKSSVQSSKSLPVSSAGQQSQKRPLPGDLRSKDRTGAAPPSRDSSDKKLPPKPAPPPSTMHKQYKPIKRPPAPSGIDFNKLMQQASCNISGKPMEPASIESADRIRSKGMTGPSAGDQHRSSTERFSSKHSASRTSDTKYGTKERYGGGPSAKVTTAPRQSSGRSTDKNLSRDGGGKTAAAAGKEKGNLARVEEDRRRIAHTNSAGKKVLPGDIRAKTQPQQTSAPPSSASAQPQQVKRYLPGDARYVGGPAKAGPEGFGKKPLPPSASSSSSTLNRQQQLHNGARRPGEKMGVKRSLSPPRPSGSSSSAAVSLSKKPRRDSSPIDDNLARIRARERFKYEAARRATAASRYDDDVTDEEEEYDSEMDDFIDDTELDDLQRGDFEDTLRMINPRYNKEKWRRRELEIDERQMVASYRDITAEEKRSARLGLIEDVKEAQKGRSYAL